MLMYSFLLLEIIQVFIHCKCRNLALPKLLCILVLIHQWNWSLTTLLCLYVVKYWLWLLLSPHFFLLLKRGTFIFLFIQLHNKLGLCTCTFLFCWGCLLRWLTICLKRWWLLCMCYILNLFCHMPICTFGWWWWYLFCCLFLHKIILHKYFNQGSTFANILNFCATLFVHFNIVVWIVVQHCNSFIWLNMMST
jgi:hypothetical protein